MTAIPPTTSLASVKGPSVTLNLPSVRRTRAPFELGRQPSVASSFPDFKPSSTSFPILAISSCVGGVPSGLLDLYKHRNRMTYLLYRFEFVSRASVPDRVLYERRTANRETDN